MQAAAVDSRGWLETRKGGRRREAVTTILVNVLTAGDVAKCSLWFQNRRNLVIYKRTRERSFDEMDGQAGPRHRSGASHMDNG